MSVELVRRLLDEKKWDLCSGLAEELMCGDISAADRAFLAYAACRALSNQEKYSLALRHGQTAEVLAEQVRDYDLLGKSLMELAFAQGLVPGHELDAIDSLKKFLEHEDKYSPALKGKMTEVLFNLGIGERSAMRHADASVHFEMAWDRSHRTADHALTELIRENLSWQALMTGDLGLAEKMISLGEQYARLHPQEKAVQAHVLTDKARYNLIRQDYPQAIALAMEGVVLAGELNNPDLLAWCLITWSTACEMCGDPESGLAMGMWALQEAQRSQRPELIAEVRRTIRGMRMHHPEAVDALMKNMLGKPETARGN
jgi:tetratricopeptide (TPR) repeat protein